MTSTPFNVGLGDGSRLSSRVLRPPGGGHTDIFGGEPEPPRTGRRGRPVEEPRQVNGAQAPVQSEPAPEPAPAPAPEPTPTPVTPDEAPQPKPQSPKATTPTDKATTPIETKATLLNEAPKRVRVPPGGFSSGLW